MGEYDPEGRLLPKFLFKNKLNNMPKTTTWRERFAASLPDFEGDYYVDIRGEEVGELRERILSFIAQEIESAKEEERDRIKEKVEEYFAPKTHLYKSRDEIEKDILSHLEALHPNK